MLDFCDRVMTDTSGLELEALLADQMRYDAVLRNLEWMGEAATRVPVEVRARAPDVPWRQIIGTRNRLAQAYLTIEIDTVWLVITGHLPLLRPHLATLAAGSIGGRWFSPPSVSETPAPRAHAARGT